MTPCFALSELSQKEKERVMLLLAAADDNAWCLTRDAQKRLCIEWRLSITSPTLSALPLGPAQAMHAKSAFFCEVAAGHENEPNGRMRHCNLKDQLQQGFFSPRMQQRSVSRAQGHLSTKNDSSYFAENTYADHDLWTSGCGRVTRCGDGDQHIASDILSFSAHNSSPTIMGKQRTSDDVAIRVKEGGSFGLSRRTVEDYTPLISGQPTFLRRRFTGQWQYCTPRPSLSGRCNGLNLSGERRKRGDVAANMTCQPNECFENEGVVRTAQWVSRLIEDLMSSVAKMTVIDSKQISTVAALTVNLLKARYGVHRWNRTLKELAHGLHRYHGVSPLCYVFREMFVDETTSALESFFLFSQLYRGALKHGRSETQKVSIQLVGPENTTSQSLHQNTIVLRRYIELRMLTVALNDMLTAVSVADNRYMGNVSVVRRRKLRPAEMIGAKTVVAHWVEEESARPDSLAFDLDGFVDMYELLYVVVSALGSVVRRSKGVDQTAHEQEPLGNNNTKAQHQTTTGIEASADKNVNSMSYAERARSIFSKRFFESNNFSTSVQPSFVSPPSLNLQPSSKDCPNGLARTVGGARSLMNPLGSKASVGRRPSFQCDGPQRPDVLQRKKEGLHILLKEDSFDCDGRKRRFQSTQDNVTATGALPLQPPHRPSEDPFVVDLNSEPAAANSGVAGQTLVPLSLSQCKSTESPSKSNSDARQVADDMQPQQYLAALAAIDAELQNRREILKTSVAFDPTAGGTGVDRESSVQLYSTQSPQKDESFITSSVEYTPKITPLTSALELYAAETDMEEHTGSFGPPAIAGTFSSVVPTSFAANKQSFCKHAFLEKLKSERSSEHAEIDDEEKTKESDFEMLTLEEHQLLIELQKKLNPKK